MTSCIVGKKIRAMGPGPLELFPFVLLATLMAMAGGISEHMLTSWSSVYNLIHLKDLTSILQKGTSFADRKLLSMYFEAFKKWELLL